jgi:hypothetical protein
MFVFCTTGKTIVAVQLNSAVRHHTAKISLPCDRSIVHGNETAHGKGAIERTATSSARQRGSRAHGKERPHGKERSQRTTKKRRTAKAEASARQRTQPRQRCLCRAAALCHAHTSFFIFFHFCFIIFTPYVYFSISFKFC